MELHGALGGVCRHVLFDHHAELDIVAAAIDLLAGEESVERWVFGHGAHVSC